VNSHARGGRLLGPAALVLPAAALIFVFLVIPYINILIMSVRVPSTSAPYDPGFTLANFQRALGDSLYLGILERTLAVGLATSLICLLLGFPVAFHLARTRTRFRGALYACILSPLLVSVVIRCYGWIIILANNGLINTGLRDAGIIEGNLPLMYNEFGVIVGLVHINLPFMILSLLGAMHSIDPGLEEAARSLGASERRVFSRVVIPLAMPGIQSGTILVFVLAISAYVTPVILGGSRVKLMAPLVVQQLIEAFLWPFGAALALVLATAGGIAVWLWARLTLRLMRGVA
jgi:putative spermidine/putrescine transport system permease protein